MWGLGAYVGYEIMARIFKHEKLPVDWVEKLFLYMIFGTVVGARIGHCLFYGWEYYSANPIEILYVWEGGLSSHGGAIGILIAMYLYNKKVSKKGFIWIFDRLVIPVALIGAFIRFGNLMNSEIYGEPTTLPWGFIFVRNGDDWASHPTQIYEMLYCLVAFTAGIYLYAKKKAFDRQGLIFGVFLVIVFGTRFMLEFIKNDQETFESSMLLNMGQLLSFPFAVWGIWLILKAVAKRKA
jgi:prolipoprotein diacylglyceryl transferase